MWKRSLSVLLLLLLLSAGLYSEPLSDYSEAELIAELAQILDELETENTKLKSLLTKTLTELEKQKESQKTQIQALDELETYWKNYAAEKQAEIFWTAAISGLVGVATGLVFGIIVK